MLQLFLGHDGSITGNGNAVTDGNNLTIDTITGFEWLDTTLSSNMSYNQIAAEFGSGGLFEGFQFATRADIATFWLNAGISPVPNFFIAEDSDIPILQAAWNGGRIVANPTNMARSEKNVPESIKEFCDTASKK